jgi:hypothetical protein
MLSNIHATEITAGTLCFESGQDDGLEIVVELFFGHHKIAFISCSAVLVASATSALTIKGVPHPPG